MEKVAIVSKFNREAKELKKQVKGFGLKLVEKNPDFVISLGGDGTYLFAMRTYPSAPKILIRDSSICHKCNKEKLEHILADIKTHDYIIEEHIKLEAKLGKKGITAVNDIGIRNDMPMEALRFEVYVNGKKVNKEFVGDGLIAATPFGSTAYFKSVTGKTFKKGIGIAFNNITEKHAPLIVSENAVIKIKIKRKDADLFYDNDPKIIKVKEGSVITIRKSNKNAKIIRLKKGIKGLARKLRQRRISL